MSTIDSTLTGREDALLVLVRDLLDLVNPDQLSWEPDEDPIDPKTDEAVKLTWGAMPYQVWLRCETELAIGTPAGELLTFDLGGVWSYWFARGRSAAWADKAAGRSTTHHVAVTASGELIDVDEDQELLRPGARCSCGWAPTGDPDDLIQHLANPAPTT